MASLNKVINSCIKLSSSGIISLLLGQCEKAGRMSLTHQSYDIGQGDEDRHQQMPLTHSQGKSWKNVFGFQRLCRKFRAFAAPTSPLTSYLNGQMGVTSLHVSILPQVLIAH